MSCLGIHVCFLYLTCIQTQFFGNWTEEQAPTPDGVAERNVTGNMAALRKAQHERRHLADERWRCWKIQVMQTVAPAVMPQDVGPPRRTCTWNEKGNIIPVSFTRKKVIAHFELRELKTGEKFLVINQKTWSMMAKSSLKSWQQQPHWQCRPWRSPTTWSQSQQGRSQTD